MGIRVFKRQTIRMVAVFAHGAHSNARAICQIPLADAIEWCNQGGAKLRANGKAIELSLPQTQSLIGQSVRMGSNVIEANADDQKWANALVSTWNPRPKIRRMRRERTRIDSGHYSLPEMA